MSGPNQQTAPPRGEPRYQALDGVDYDEVNEFVRDKTWLTAREWAVAGLAEDHRAETGVEVTALGERAPEAVPWIEDELSPGNVGQTRHRIEDKVRKSLTTTLWALYSGALTVDEIDDLVFEATETARFLLEIEGVGLPFDRERIAEDRLADAARRVRDYEG